MGNRLESSRADELRAEQTARMTSDPTLPTEADRLSCLATFDILDTAEEPVFDDIVRVAAQIAGLPYAVIAFAQRDRATFKARIGIDWLSIPLNQSFCGHTIRNPGKTLIVPDASLDARFAQLLLVAGPMAIRSYIGASIVSSSGFALGTVSCFGPTPFTPTTAQVKALEALARQVSRMCDDRIRQHELVQLQRELLLERDYLAAMTANTVGAVVEVSAKGVITYANSAAAAVLGLKQGDSTRYDDPGWEPTHVDGSPLPPEENPVTIVMRTRLPVRDYRIGVRKRDGKEAVISVSAGPLFHQDGTLRAVLCNVVDITEQNRAEEALQAEQERNRLLALVASSTDDAVLITDRRGRIDWVNAAFTRLTGFSLNEARGKQVPDLLHGPQTDPRTVEQIQRCIPNGEGFKVELVNYRKDGTPYWVQVCGNSVRDADGSVERYVAVMSDTTERHESEAALRNSEERLRLALDATDDGIWDWDTTTGQVTVSEHWHTMLGLPSATRTTFTFVRALIHPEDLPIIDSAVSDHLNGLTPMIQAEVRLRHAKGHWINVLTRGRIVRWSDLGHPLRVVGTHVDLTREVEARQLLDEERQRLQIALEGANIGMWDWDIGTGKAFFTDIWFRMLGYEPSDLPMTVQTWERLAHPDDLLAARAALEQHFRGETATFRLEMRLKNKAGDWQWILDAGKVVEWTEDGQPRRMIGVHQDIDSMKRVQDQLASKKQLLKTFIERTPAAVAMFDREMRYIATSRRWLADFKLSERDLVGQSHYEVFPDIPERWKQIHKRCLNGAVEACDHDPFPRADGTTDYVRWEVAPWRDADGMIGGMIIFTQVVTAEVLAASELQAARDRAERTAAVLEAQQNSSLDGIIIVDEQQHVVAYNKQFLDLWQIDGSPSDLGGTDHFLTRVVNERVADPAGFLARVVELYGRPDATARDEIQLNDGRTFDRYTAPVRLPDNTYMGRFWSFRDLTERKQVERQLAAARDAADAANRAKSEFLANMSHELRTPLTAILGFADLLTDGAPTPEQLTEFLQTIRRNGEHLLGIINDVLDLSKIEAQRLTLESLDASPRQMLNDVAELFRGRAGEKKIDIRAVIDPAVPATIRTDPLRLRQVLMNLASNAVKFTDHGTVTLCADIGRKSSGKPVLRLSVSDTGIGIAASKLDRLFQPFEQADSSTTRRFGGTGLGLSICERLIRLMGGELTVVSKPRRGSTFTCTLPLPATLPNEAATLPSKPVDHEPQVPRMPINGRLTGRRGLVAEDGPDNQRLIAFLMRRAGAEVEVVADGQAALDRASASHFDFVLMDMQMPIMDGYTAVTQLRTRGNRTPIIALTAHAMDGDREHCLRTGCDGYCSKPLDPQKLVYTIERLLASKTLAA
ncbi:MAG: PAS domain S-box protein [Tepidisphaeraceae bacterium]